jgi:lycopene cyclase domain-containing protein
MDRERFYAHKKALFAAIIITAFFFIIWDVIFTNIGVWGFTSKYNLGIIISGLPIEEIFFFMVVPFSCHFIHASLIKHLPISFSKKTNDLFAILLIVGFGILAGFNTEKHYTFFVSVYSSIVLTITYFLFRIDWFDKFMLSYLVSLIPFFAINGLLTGMATSEPVVWYNDQENLGLRIITIPVEDFIYNFALFFTNLFLFYFIIDKLNLKKKNN